jgi:hypothetical protein
MKLTSVRVAVVVVAAALLAVGAGCGGGSKKSASSTSTQMSTTTSSTQTTTGNSGSDFASAKNCQDLAGIAAKAASALTAAGGNPATALQKEAQILQGLASAAPSDIRSDFQTIASAFSDFVSKLEQAGYKPGSTTAPSATQLAALASAAKVFNTAKLKAAEQHLNAWAKQNCKGVNPGG